MQSTRKCHCRYSRAICLCAIAALSAPLAFGERIVTNSETVHGDGQTAQSAAPEPVQTRTKGDGSAAADSSTGPADQESGEAGVQRHVDVSRTAGAHAASNIDRDTSHSSVDKAYRSREIQSIAGKRNPLWYRDTETLSNLVTPHRSASRDGRHNVASYSLARNTSETTAAEQVSGDHSSHAVQGRDGFERAQSISDDSATARHLSVYRSRESISRSRTQSSAASSRSSSFESAHATYANVGEMRSSDLRARASTETRRNSAQSASRISMATVEHNRSSAHSTVRSGAADTSEHVSIAATREVSTHISMMRNTSGVYTGIAMSVRNTSKTSLLRPIVELQMPSSIRVRGVKQAPAGTAVGTRTANDRFHVDLILPAPLSAGETVDIKVNTTRIPAAAANAITANVRQAGQTAGEDEARDSQGTSGPATPIRDGRNR